MSAATTLKILASGAPVTSGVLGTCRLESGNTDAFGVEAVGDAFRRAPMADAATGIIVEAPGHLAIFSADQAVVADLFSDAIGRLWRIGQADPGTPEPAVGVAFDTDLRQVRASVFVDIADHPALASDAIDRIEAIGRDLIHATGADAPFRARAFAVRAFGDSNRGCVLFAVQALAANPMRTPSLSFAAARWDGGATQVVRDTTPPRAPLVRIVT